MLRHPLNAGTERAAVSAQEKNYSKILEIQGQLVSAQVFGAVYPALLDLASRHRIFINEIDLKKVCRKSNKLFRFWLFNDCLIYGCLLESGQYLFHRKIDLVTCYIMIYKSLVYKYALEVAGAEKSFIVMAKNEYEQMHWMNAVLDAIANLRGSPSLNSDSNPNVTFHKSHPQLDVTSSPFWDTSYDAGTPPLSPESSRCLDLRSELSLANIKDSKSQHSSTLKSAKTNCCSICNEVRRSQKEFSEPNFYFIKTYLKFTCITIYRYLEYSFDGMNAPIAG